MPTPYPHRIGSMSSHGAMGVLLIISLLLAVGFPARAAVSDVTPRDAKRYIILFEKPVTQQHVRAALKNGAHITRAFESIPALAVSLREDSVAAILQNAGVVRIMEDSPVHASLTVSVPHIGANRVWQAGTDGAGARVCIVDTGIDTHHAALPVPVAQYDFVNDDANAHDDAGHGTHVAGIALSRDATYTGVAPGASLMAAKVLDANGSGYTSDVIAGMEWCVKNGADIINMSLGGRTYRGVCDVDPLAQAANAAVTNGVTVFAASGNDGSINKISTPACAGHVIAVGAVDATDRRASYSNGGAKLDIVAPGTGITSLYPTNGIRKLSGTSMASPHAAGLAALLLSAQPSLTPEQIRQVVRDTAVDLGSIGFDTRYGYGRIDALAAYRSVTQTPISSSSSSSSSSPSSSSSSSPSPSSSPSSTRMFFDDFQSGLNRWDTSGTPNWTTLPPAERAVPGTNDDNTVAHADDCESACVLSLRQSLDLRSFDSVTLSFWRFVDRSLDDGEELRLEAFDGAAWVTLAAWSDGTGNDDRWHREQIVLPSRFLHREFRLRFVTVESSRIEEVEVDDVELTGMIADR